MLLSLCARLLLRLIAFLCLLGFALPAFGGRPLAPDEVWDDLGFTACDLPCFAGVVPGRTGFQTAPEVLRNRLPLIGRRMFYNNAVLSFWASSARYELAGWAGYDRGMVGELRLTAPVPFDYLLDHLGTPDCIMPRIPPTERSGVYWIREGVSIVALLSLDQHNFDLTTRSTGLWLRAFRPDDCAGAGAVGWRGFTSTAEYLPAS
jgi:hypothetical protein